MVRSVRWMTAGLVFLCVATVFANDGTFGGKGADIYPVENADVRLVREAVTFDQMGDTTFAVSALLVFRNETEDTARSQVGFPDMETMIDDLEIYVDGDRVDKLRRGSYTPTEGPSWGTVYLFDIAFPPGRPVSVLHNYLLATSRYAGGEALLFYVLRTGGMWRGTIEEAVFRFRFVDPPAALGLHCEGQHIAGWNWGQPEWGDRIAKPLDEDAVGFNYWFDFVGGPQAAFSVTFRDFDPTGDLILAHKRRGATALGVKVLRLLPHRLPETRMCYRTLECFIDDLELTEELLSCYEPSLLRNLVYARRGYRFENEELDRLFYESGAFMLSSAPFDSTWLTRDEVRVIEGLRRIEAQQSEAP